ncbi:nitrous oxidase accessory protein [Lutimaribacter pacificus]|uniref:Nitrous oxidase accessory protein n=1 Tax=Lutimaribacter pacificus TaxID=391948 RepID=A0A1H0NSH6_9RHOB|nr:nitrous oxide reductase family maturation protein NosD [Lutimaribacter pacificus]SDO95697.1 nitrous oxidase accessory protein [Lutimaribacter pacificus]SHK95602.1 nitrous oxidase accessory protein [Lutimaribacter pacificus]
MPLRFLILIVLLASAAHAEDVQVPAESGALKAAVAGATPGDVLTLSPGRHEGPVTLSQPITLNGGGKATVDAGGRGSVITVTGEDITVRGLTVIGSGSDHQTIDSGVQLTKTARRAVIEDNRILGNLYGVDIHGADDSIVRGNVIEGRQDRRMNDRGNGVYVWNAPGAQVVGNDIRYGRDGIFVNTSRRNTFRDNLFRDLRFAVHYMYANDSEVSGNISIGNHLGYALMFSDRVKVLDNLSLNDRDHGLMLNYANNSDLRGNLVRGADKCTFIYNAHRNLIVANRFEGCDIGIHFTAGSERNALTENAFIGNRTQVKYVGTTDVEWSFERIGNYWSDHATFDLDGNGIADSPFRPNDLMDHILWSQPAAALLVGAPAVQLIRWSQSSFPATLPGGVLDSHPLMTPVRIAVPDDMAGLIAQSAGKWRNGKTDDTEFDPLAAH